MTFGWDLTTTDGRDTALNEIGHALAFPHEHQNPIAGIVWDEDAVITSFAGPPNNWTESKTRRNILDKLPVDAVSGSGWDRNFEAGLIDQPVEFRSQPLIPANGLSTTDIEQVRSFYPPIANSYPDLRPFEAKLLNLGPGDQANFAIVASTTRWFNFRTFGDSDTVMVLFEDEGGDLRYRAGDDDSGTNLNASFAFKLIANHK